MTKVPASAQRISRAQLLLFGFLTALGATLFTIAFFDVLTPPREPSAVLTPPTSAHPTEVPTEVPTAIPVVTLEVPAIPSLYLEDNFSTRNNWPRVVSSAPYGYVQDGYQLAPASGADLHVFLLNYKDTVSHDLSLGVEANPVSGSTGINYGVFFWHDQDKSGQERFLYFGIGSDRKYTFKEWAPNALTLTTPNSARWIDLVPETTSRTIHTDGVSNQLRIDLHPHRILAFINGSLVLDRDNPDVDAFRNSPDFDGRVGLLAFSLGEPGAKVLFTLFDLYSNVQK